MALERSTNWDESCSSQFGISSGSSRLMTFQHILVEVRDGVGLVTLDRPEALNALSDP